MSMDFKVTVVISWYMHNTRHPLMSEAYFNTLLGDFCNTFAHLEFGHVLLPPIFHF